MKLHEQTTSNGLIYFQVCGSINGQFIPTCIDMMTAGISADVLELEQIRTGTTPPIIIVIIVHSSYDHLAEVLDLEISEAADVVVVVLDELAVRVAVIVVVENHVDGAESD